MGVGGMTTQPQPIILDFETYYDKEYSLSKMSNMQYVMSPLFEAIGCSVDWGDGHGVQWYAAGAHLDAAMRHLKSLPTTLVIAHNAVFDASILRWRYGIAPTYVVCTLSAARSVGVVSSVGGSLAALADTMRAAGIDIPRKGTEVYNNMGKRAADFTPEQLVAYGAYCSTDVVITKRLFEELCKELPNDEWVWQDTVLKMYVNSGLQIDVPVVEEELARVRLRRKTAAERLATTLGVPDVMSLLPILNSGPKFAEALKLFGAEPPTKISKATGNSTWAMGKTDPEFLAMLEHDDENVRELVTARLGLKSSIEETRCETFLEVAKYGMFPVPYKISGALTHRLSGGE